MIRVDIDANDIKKYLGKQIEVKTGNLQHEKVVFNVQTDYSSIAEVLSYDRGNISSIQYVGRPEDEALTGVDLTGVYTFCKVDLGASFTDDDIKAISQTNPQLNMVVPLKPDFKDIRRLWKLSNQFKNVRYNGGKLLALKGVNLGEVPIERYNQFSKVIQKDLKDQKFLSVYPYGELVLGEAKPSVQKTRGTGVPREHKQKIRHLSFADMLKRS